VRLRIIAAAGIAVLVATAGATAAPAPAGGQDTAAAALVEVVPAPPLATTSNPAPDPTPAPAPAPAVVADSAVAPTTEPVPTVPAPSPVTPSPVSRTSPNAALTCVAPTDATAIDAVLAAAGSPLEGDGETFVQAATAADLDPRALVAIAAHETILATYGPSQGIRNPFGLGPGMSFSTYADAIRFAASTLRTGYLDEGRLTLGPIGAKWAPIGASNDPTDLNSAWEGGVGGYYADLGGDPAQPVLLSVQGAGDLCGASGTAATAPQAPAAPGPEAVATAAPAGPPVVRAWDGSRPDAGATAAEGAGADGAPAVIDGFVFPLALPVEADLAYSDGFSEPGAPGCHGQAWRCATAIEPPVGTAVVAAAPGLLEAAAPAEAEAGITFWIRTGTGERIGYGPLAAYADGVGPGAAVAAGQALGAAGPRLTFAWERDGARINPHPLLMATRPSTPA
jgi:hypothetical protein